MSTITERVAAGVAFLDLNDPEWWKADTERAIDLDTLNMESGNNCVLGQRCPLERKAAASRFVSEYDVLAMHYSGRTSGYRADDWARPLGFQACDPSDYQALTAEWKRVITERRSAP